MEPAASPARIGGEHSVAEEDTALEFMMNALRLIDGFSVPLYALNTGTPMHPLQPIISQAIDDGLLKQHALMLHPTEKGINFLNDLLNRFMPDSTSKSYPVIPLLSKTSLT